MDPFTISAIASGLGALFGRRAKSKQNAAQDAYTNTAGQSKVDYSNAQANYNMGLQNQTAVKDEKSRVAKERMRGTLLKTLGGPSKGTYGAGGARDAIIDFSAIEPSFEENARYNPIDYTGAPMQTYTPTPSSNTGGFTGALADLFGLVSQGANARGQAQDYEAEMDKYRFALQNPGVDRMPTSNVNYSKILQSVFGQGR